MSLLSLLFLTILSGQALSQRLCKVPLSSYTRDSDLNFTQRTSINGCPSEEHTVITEDGYILTVFRMRGCGCCQDVKKTPVLVFHGLVLSSDSWLDPGPESSLPYLLARVCYDVWLANERGSYHGRRHIQLNPDNDSDFWKFYVNEMGRYDIPATIDYVLKNTRSDRLNYIGYSQGATVFLIMCSERPEYKRKVDLSILLAPASRGKYTKSEVFKVLSYGVKVYEKRLYKSKIYEILTVNGLGRMVASLCRDPYAAETICGGGLGVLDAFHSGSMSKETLSVMFNHFPAGTSARNMAWYGQTVTGGTFARFDYGEEENLQLYGVVSPPPYNISAVTVPTVVMYGRKDLLVDTEDVKWLVERLPNLIESVEVIDPQWNHLDFAFSRHVKRTIFPSIDNFLRTYNSVP